MHRREEVHRTPDQPRPAASIPKCRPKPRETRAPRTAWRLPKLQAGWAWVTARAAASRKVRRPTMVSFQTKAGGVRPRPGRAGPPGNHPGCGIRPERRGRNQGRRLQGARRWRATMSYSEKRQTGLRWRARAQRRTPVPPVARARRRSAASAGPICSGAMRAGRRTANKPAQPLRSRRVPGPGESGPCLRPATRRASAPRPPPRRLRPQRRSDRGKACRHPAASHRCPGREAHRPCSRTRRWCSCR